MGRGMARRDSLGAMFVRIPGNSRFMRVATASISDIQEDGEAGIESGVLRVSRRGNRTFSISISPDMNSMPISAIVGGKIFDAVIVYGDRAQAGPVESLERIDGALALRNCSIGSASRSNVLSSAPRGGSLMALEMSATASEVTDVKAGELSVSLSTGASETVVAIDAYEGCVAALSIAKSGADYRVRLRIYDGSEWRTIVVGDYAPLSNVSDYRVSLCKNGKAALVTCERTLLYLSVFLVDTDGHIARVSAPYAEVLSFRRGRHLYVGFSNGVASRLEGKRLIQVANAPSGTYSTMALSASGDSFVFCSASSIVTVDSYNRPSIGSAPISGANMSDICMGESSGVIISKSGVVYTKDSKSAAWRQAAQITGGGSSPVVACAHISWPLMVVAVQVAKTPAATTVDAGTAPPLYSEPACVVMASLDGVHWVEVVQFDRRADEDRGPIFAVSSAGGAVLAGGLRRWPTGPSRLLKFDGVVLAA